MDDVIKVSGVKVCYSPLIKGKKQSSSGKRRVAFWALRGVSFDIHQGEILGIIGKNGSGKTTLLRVLSGLIKPDAGSVEMGSRRVSLLGLGSSLQPELTGRENIYLIGLQLGFTKDAIDKKYRQIVEFAELASVIDRPVRTYSAGMRSKLSFSIAVYLATEVMLIDELLSVGDMAFRQKSYAKMKELITDRKHTVVIVSHDLGRLKNLCNRVLWVDNGRVRMLGDSAEVVQAYQNEYTRTEGKVLVSTDVQVPDLLEVQPTKRGLTVIWGSVSDATGYTVYRKQGNKGYQKIGHVSGGLSDRYEDTTAQPGQTYQYTVRAYRSFNGVTDRSAVQASGIIGTMPAQEL